jgi:hypothetical protein
MRLTGRCRLRKSLFGKATVLQVEEEVASFWPMLGNPRRRWRDARKMDLRHPALRLSLDAHGTSASPPVSGLA